MQIIMENSELRLPNIGFDMPITDLIMELEKMRYKIIESDTHPLVFRQICQIFQTLESVGSSRIEGNNTTIMDYVENTKINKNENKNNSGPAEDIMEILNIEKAMEYIEENINDIPISLMFIRELHQLTVDNLSYRKEGAQHPGCFREQNVRIGGSNHTPPDYTQVVQLMQELLDFVNREDSAKYDLLKIAIAHHRFVWIHPFENGNGRVVRLFTYALLLKSVFKSRDRIINPTAVFCTDRDAYYRYLSKADTGTDEGLIAWSEYMLKGLCTEIEKIDRLADYTYLKANILLPALVDSRDNAYVTPTEYSILKATITKSDQIIQSSDIAKLFPNASGSDRSRMIRALLDKGMLIPTHDKARRYVIAFSNSYLLRSILKMLDVNGFLPIHDGGLLRNENILTV